jgi:hypothetical protein
MELLQLEPPDYGVRATGIYIIDDDGLAVFAGPFDSETAAISWIDQRQENLNRQRSAHEPALLWRRRMPTTFPTGSDTTGNPMVRTLVERLRGHEQQKARLVEQEVKLKNAERKARTRRLIEAGGLVDKAGLARSRCQCPLRRAALAARWRHW